MEISGIGRVTRDDELGWYYSEPIPVALLGGQMCRIIVEGYDDDPNPNDFHVAIRNFLTSDFSILKEAEQHIFRYYKDCNKDWNWSEDQIVCIASPGDVWKYIELGTEPLVTRRADGDQRIYISLECECDWEEEHGLQIVFKNGSKVNKVGQYDGHYTNSDAYDDESLEDVIYQPM